MRLPPHGGSGLKLRALSLDNNKLSSPSTRREWIEMTLVMEKAQAAAGLPPHGGSGLKSFRQNWKKCLPWSPSTRREWIEMPHNQRNMLVALRLPPHGGSGLKLDFNDLVTLSEGLPPHGGSGLKSMSFCHQLLVNLSPSTRREWIEIANHIIV